MPGLQRRVGVAVNASSWLSVDLGSFSLSNHSKELKTGIHSIVVGAREIAKNEM